MPALNSRVWRRYGQLRIYVSAGDQAVGWFDPLSGRSQLSQPDSHDEFWAIVRSECQQLLRGGIITESELARLPGVAAPPTHWVVRDPEWDDLSRNEPGAAASARARELRHEHPLLTTAAGLLGIRTSAQTFAAGARGERTVGRQLSRWAARYGWHVLHAVPVGQRGADIDHVVIGPFGVVTVNTKTTGTTVWVGEHALTLGGKSVDYLRQSRQEAAREPTAQPGDRTPGAGPACDRVRAGASRHDPPGGPADVAVLASPRLLRRWLCRRQSVLPPSEVAAIYQAARRPSNWQSRPRPPR